MEESLTRRQAHQATRVAVPTIGTRSIQVTAAAAVISDTLTRFVLKLLATSHS